MESSLPYGQVGFGAMGMTAFYGAAMSPDDSLALLQGVYNDLNSSRHFDTAEVYKSGDLYNESVLGAFLPTVPRETFTIGTKFMPWLWGNKADYDTVKNALQLSLSRLGLEYVDIYYMHRIPNVEAVKEFAASCKRLIEEGLIRHVGLSECSGPWLREAHQVCPISVVQQEWSLLTRNLEEELVPTCAELGVGIVAYSPLSRNLLTDTTEKPPESDWRSNLPRYTGAAHENNLRLQQEVKSIADRKGVSTAQLSLAWLLYQAPKLGVRVLPIPGTTKLVNAQSNFAAVQIELEEGDASPLEELAARVQGSRYTEQMMASTIDNQEGK
jgi:aryl-alcohol dehydrogenase-like predicted oxidoreductase